MEAFEKWFEENKNALEADKDDLYFICKIAFLAGETEQIKQRLKDLKNGSN